MPLATYLQVLGEHRFRLNRLIDKRGVASMSSLYDRASAEVLGKLTARAPSSQSEFTAHQQRVFLAQLRQGQAVMARRMAGELGDITDDAAREALRGLGGDLRRLDKEFRGAGAVLPLEDAARFQGVLGKQRSILRDVRERALSNWSMSAIGKVEDQLAMALLTGETTGTAIDRVQNVIGGEWYRAERIVRTETAWASNATYHDGLTDAKEQLPDLMMRWSEHVDDRTGQPFDDRVGDDSIAMHGQVAPVGGMFTMPNDPNVSVKMWGKKWAHPPNRPNDRAVLSPWRKAWGVPGWILRGGRKVDLV